ncbi:hypothetical protein FOCC_FOCC013730 [Frankliniella occidentalis]|nr:hypothetical protein FOCC_FOCC013730 [Frankliniella occidentalis]
MHTFPKLNCDDTGKSYDKYVVWITNSCNPKLLMESVFALNRRFFYCGEHFDPSFVTEKGMLVRRAVPTLLCPEPLNLADVAVYLQRNGVKKLAHDDGHVEMDEQNQLCNDVNDLYYFDEDVMEVEVSDCQIVADVSSNSDVPMDVQVQEYDSPNEIVYNRSCLDLNEVAVSVSVEDEEDKHRNDANKLYYFDEDVMEFEVCDSQIVADVSISSDVPMDVQVQANDASNEVVGKCSCLDLNAVEVQASIKSNVSVVDVLEIVLALDSQNETVASVNKSVPGKRVYSKCSVSGCGNNNSTHSMFGFPRVNKIVEGQHVTDDIELRRCNDHHFVDTDFTSKDRKKLKRLVVPTANRPDMNVSSVNSLVVPPCNVNESSGNCENPRIAEALDCLREMTSEQSRTLGNNFDEKLKSFKYEHCSICNEKYLYYPGMKRAHRKKTLCRKFSSQNQMDPGAVPLELQGLTFIEEQLIARVHPVLSVYKLKGCQYGYKGNVINFFQDVQGFATQLPHRIEDISSIITVTFKNHRGDSCDFQVRAKKVRDALVWLKANNEFYSCIEISDANLDDLPEDGNVYDQVSSYCADSDNNANDSDTESEEELIEDRSTEFIQSSGVPLIPVSNQNQQVNAALNWPEMNVEPVSEFVPGFIMSAFPCLFPYGNCDLNEAREKKVKMHEYFKHLLLYEDGRFAKHQTFRFFCFNMWMRHTALRNGNVFVEKDSDLIKMTVKQLKIHLNTNQSARNKLMFMGSNLRGSKAYWKSRCGELKDMVEQLGLPTIILTMSAADLYWPDLLDSCS